MFLLSRTHALQNYDCFVRRQELEINQENHWQTAEVAIKTLKGRIVSRPLQVFHVTNQL